MISVQKKIINTEKIALQMNSLLALVAIVLFSLVPTGNASAQDKIPPANWKHSLSKSEVKIGEVIEIILKTDIPDGLHIYSNDFSEDCPPQKAELTFINNNGSYEPIGKMVPTGSEKMMDDIFRCEVSIFHHHALFKQKVRILKKDPVINASLFYQMCTEEQCINFDHKFSAGPIKIIESAASEVSPKQTNETISEEAAEAIDTQDTSDSINDEQQSEEDTKVSDETETDEEQISDDTDDVRNKSLWALFILGVLGGIPALLTPCVYPMIPMTVAFFTKQDNKSKGKKMATMYGISIVLIYVTFGVLLAVFFGKTFAYALSTHWLPNILFFLVFVIFAISFFGMFELTLPSSFVNRMNSQSDRGGYIGVFFVAFTLVLVSFSCTAPIVGSVAVLASDGAIIEAVAAMLGFALTFALPFSLFAYFPQWLNKMPQSGGWLNSVKVILGFLELGLALKFLSQADLAYHWGILDRDVFLALWIIIAFTAGFYLLGKIKFPHDSDLPFISVPRFFMALVFLSFGAYMVPGLWGAPLKPLAGILPPMHTQDFKGNQMTTSSEATHESTDNIKYGDLLHVPAGFSAYFDYNQALEVAKKERKPIFVDFTGHTCANCRRMEEKVWIDPEIKSRLNNNFIMLSLYCDERFELPEEEWSKDENGEVLKSIGDQNKYRQYNQFGSNGQPSYYVMDWEENIYTKSLGYKPDIKGYTDFLDEGKAKFEAWLANQ